MSVSLALVMALSVSRLGQGQAREAGTEKSGVLQANLSRAEGQYSLRLGRWSPERKAPMIVDHDITPVCVTSGFVVG
jgi:hypothetical protein